MILYGYLFTSEKPKCDSKQVRIGRILHSQGSGAVNWRCQGKQDTVNGWKLARQVEFGNLSVVYPIPMGYLSHNMGFILETCSHIARFNGQLQNCWPFILRSLPASWLSDPVANIHHSQWFQPVLPYPLQPMDPIALILQEGLVKLDSTFEFSGLVCFI